jgi:hypothetical protein
MSIRAGAGADSPSMVHTAVPGRAVNRPGPTKAGVLGRATCLFLVGALKTTRYRTNPLDNRRPIPPRYSPGQLALSVQVAWSYTTR